MEGENCFPEILAVIDSRDLRGKTVLEVSSLTVLLEIRIFATTQ